MCSVGKVVEIKIELVCKRDRKDYINMCGMLCVSSDRMRCRERALTSRKENISWKRANN